LRALVWQEQPSPSLRLPERWAASPACPPCTNRSRPRGELAVPAPGLDLAGGLRAARERNPSLEVQRLAICIELQDILVQKSGYKPTLNANTGYTVENNRLSNSLGDAVHGWFFSIQGNWAIFDGLETYGKVKQAKARLEQAKANYDDNVQSVSDARSISRSASGA